MFQLTRKGLQGDSSAARASLQAIETARAKAPAQGSAVGVIRILLVGLGVDSVLRTLRMKTKWFPFDEKRVRWELAPWIVEAALARLGTRRLTIEEQRSVVAVMRDPGAVQWPEWWSVRS